MYAQMSSSLSSDVEQGDAPGRPGTSAAPLPDQAPQAEGAKAHTTVAKEKQVLPKRPVSFGSNREEFVISM